MESSLRQFLKTYALSPSTRENVKRSYSFTNLSTLETDYRKISLNIRLHVDGSSEYTKKYIRSSVNRYAWT